MKQAEFKAHLPSIANDLAPNYAPWSAVATDRNGIKLQSNDPHTSIELSVAWFETVETDQQIANKMISDLMGDLVKLGSENRNHFQFAWALLKMFIRTYWPRTTHH